MRCFYAAKQMLGFSDTTKVLFKFEGVDYGILLIPVLLMTIFLSNLFLKNFSQGQKE